MHYVAHDNYRFRVTVRIMHDASNIASNKSTEIQRFTLQFYYKRSPLNTISVQNLDKKKIRQK